MKQLEIDKEKIKLKINKVKNYLYTLLCVVRLVVCLPLIIFIVIVYLPLMTLLGVRYAGDSSIKLFEKFVFNHSDD